MTVIQLTGRVGTDRGNGLIRVEIMSIYIRCIIPRVGIGPVFHDLGMIRTIRTTIGRGSCDLRITIKINKTRAVLGAILLSAHHHVHPYRYIGAGRHNIVCCQPELSGALFCTRILTHGPYPLPHIHACIHTFSIIGRIIKTIPGIIHYFST